MKYTCPVCAFDGLEEPPAYFTICPCCGTEFGYHDFVRGHDELRATWIATGLRWHSTVISAPIRWNGFAQLKTAGFIDYEPVGADVPTQIGIVEIGQSSSIVSSPDWGSVRINSVQYVIGTVLDRLVNPRFAGAT
jgi:hypothetical protein